MLRLNCLVATFLLVLTVGAANADTTFDFSGTPVYPVGSLTPLATGLTGTLTINTTTGTVTGADIMLPAVQDLPDFTVVFISNAVYTSIPEWTVQLFNAGCSTLLVTGVPCSNSYSVSFVFIAAGPFTAPTLVGFDGVTNNEGEIASIVVDGDYGTYIEGIPIYECNEPSNFPTVSCGAVSPMSPGTTPLPAALPLFATGLGALGLFGWRRKWKAAAIAAA